jgi:hypothetical protein
MDDTSKRVDARSTIADRSEEIAGRSDEAVVGFAGPPSLGDEDTRLRTGQIRREIEQTRDDMSETIDAIQERLRPRNIVASAAERMKEATTDRVREIANTAAETAGDVMAHTREATSGLADGVRQNPIPSALIGIGAAWLVMKRSQSRSVPAWERADRTAGLGTRGNAASEYAASAYGTTKSRERADADEPSAWGLVERVRNNPIGAALAGLGLAWLAFSPSDRRVRRAVPEYPGEGGAETIKPSWTGTASEALSSAGSEVSQAAERVATRAQEYAGDAAATIRGTGRRAQTQIQRLMEDNPLIVGAGALVLGAAVGLALPESDRENEWIGEARDNVIDRAQELARNAASTVREAAGDVAGEVASQVVGGGKE